MFSDFKRYKLEYLLAAVTILLQVYRLDKGEIQQWDESLYAVRAKAIVDHGVWLDQTHYAVGGLYSAMHPPLAVWATASIVSIFGESTLTYRLFASLCSILAVILVIAIVGTLTNRRTALLTAAIFGNAQLWLWYAHHGQLDVPMHTAVLACIYYLLRTGGSRWRNIILSGLSFGAALMIKAYQPLYVLPFLFAYGFIYRREGGLISILKVLIIGIAMVLPWYVWMFFQHPEFIGRWVSLFTSISGGTYFEQSTVQWYYYINQAVIMYPLSIVFPFIVLLPRYCLPLTDERYRIVFAGSFWMILSLIGLSLMGSKMPHFVLFLAVPSIFITAYVLEWILTVNFSVLRTVLLTIIGLAFVWSVSEHLRLLVKGSIHPYSVNVAVAAAVLVVLCFTLWYLIKDRAGYIALSIYMFTAGAVFANVYRWTVKDERLFIDGAAAVSNILRGQSGIQSIALLHSGARYNDLFPQFAFYSGGWNLGWIPNRSADVFTTSSASSILQRKIYDAVIVYREWDRYNVIPDEEYERRRVIDSSLRILYSHNAVVNRYTLYY